MLACLLGLVSLSLFDHQNIDLMGFLFGDLLAIGQQDLTWIALACGSRLRYIGTDMEALIVHYGERRISSG